jgi:hypothetical protein
MPDNKQHQDQNRQKDQIDNQEGRQINQPNRTDMDQDRQQTKQGGKSDKMEEPTKNRDNN